MLYFVKTVGYKYYYSLENTVIMIGIKNNLF